jgi:hypothetical protein
MNEWMNEGGKDFNNVRLLVEFSHEQWTMNNFGFVDVVMNEWSFGLHDFFFGFHSQEWMNEWMNVCMYVLVFHDFGFVRF